MISKKGIPKWLRIPGVIFAMLVILTLGFVIWGVTPAKPMPEVFDQLLRITKNETGEKTLLTFVPDGYFPNKGLILYPGGHVDYRAYAPTAQAIADNGYFVVIVQMPLNLAVLNPDAALDVISAYPEIEHWVVGGHSLGGAMAANFVFTHPEVVDGLVLWAAYPATSNDLSKLEIAVVSISGTQDGLSTPEKIQASIPLLPASTTWVPIDGGNHGQFGWYGEQRGDNSAFISREEQQSKIIEATVKFMGGIR